MSNIFNGCKTIGDLYNVFVYNPDVTFETSTNAELNRLADVFEANVSPADMVDIPLGETEFNHIRNFVISKVNGVIEDIQEETINPTTNNKEEMIMGTTTVKGNINAAVEEMMNKFTSAKENLKGGVKTTREEYVETVDDSLNVVKGAFGDALNVLDRGLGYSAFKESILEVIEAGQYGDSKHDLFRMAKKCRELTDKYIKKVELFGNPGDADKLKDVIENVKGESIFTMFFSTLYWIGRRAFKTLRNICQIDNEKSILGAICRSVAGFASVIRAGLKLVWNTAKFAVSFIAAGVIIVADIIIKAIMTVVSKAKDWAEKKSQKIEVFEEDFDEEDDYFANDEEDAE